MNPLESRLREDGNPPLRLITLSSEQETTYSVEGAGARSGRKR